MYCERACSSSQSGRFARPAFARTTAYITFDQVAFPLPRHFARSNLWRAQGCACHIPQSSLASRAAGGWQSLPLALAQRPRELNDCCAAQKNSDGAVVRMVRDRRNTFGQPLSRLDSCRVHQKQYACNLLGQPMAAQTVKLVAPQRGLNVRAEPSPRRATGDSSRLRPCLGYAWLVDRGARNGHYLVATDLKADGRSANAKLKGKRWAVELGQTKGLDRYQIGLCDVCIASVHLGGTIQGIYCRTSNLSEPFL